jgi:hypothetical protein
MWDKIKMWWDGLPMWGKILLGIAPFLLALVIWMGLRAAKKARNRRRTMKARRAKRKKTRRR